MTKSQVLSYLGVVLIITIAVYIYTSVAEAPTAPQSEGATMDTPSAAISVTAE